jgi:hypothetical protein
MIFVIMCCKGNGKHKTVPTQADVSSARTRITGTTILPLLLSQPHYLSTNWSKPYSIFARVISTYIRKMQLIASHSINLRDH